MIKFALPAVGLCMRTKISITHLMHLDICVSSEA